MATDYNRLPLTANLNLTAGTTYYAGYICDGTFVVGREAGTGPGSWYAPGSVSVASPPNPLASGSTNSITIMLGVELDGATAAGFGWGQDQSTGITLSLSNTLATSSASANQGARGVITHVNGSGKFYAEVALGGTLNATVAVGLASVNWGVAQGDLSGGGSPAYLGMLYQGGGRSGAVTIGGGSMSFVSGDTIGIAYDCVNHLIWWNKNNGSWYGLGATAGSPSAGTSGYSFNATTWPMTVAAATGTATAATFTLHDTAASLTYAPPAGYAAWSPYVAPVLSSQARVMVLA
jgi:hypothetical protein